MATYTVQDAVLLRRLLKKVNSGGGTGTVTSVDVSGGTTGLTATGGPVVLAGVLTLDGILNVAHGGTGNTTGQPSGAAGGDLQGLYPNPTIKNNLKVGAFGCTFDGAGASLITNTKTEIRVPFSGTITKATLLGKPGESGNIVIDVQKSTFAGYDTTASICGGAKPTIIGTNKAENNTLVGWTTAFSVGDCFVFNIDSVTSFTQVTLILDIIKN